MRIIDPKISVGAVNLAPPAVLVCKIFKKIKHKVVQDFPRVRDIIISTTWTVTAPITRIGALFDKEILKRSFIAQTSS